MKELIQLLDEQNLTCVLSQYHKIYKETANGILPLLHFLEKGLLQDAIIADKVIEKSSCNDLVYGGSKEIYRHVMSEHTLVFLAQQNILVSYQKKVPYIVNLQKNGMCPMKETVLTCDSMELAYLLFCDHVKILKQSRQ